MKTSITRRYPLRPHLCAVASAVSLCLLAPAVLAAETLAEALTGGKVSGQLRYRFEMVDQVGVPRDATASTLRTQLGYATGDYFGFNSFLQFEDVRVVGNERYNSTVNGLTQYPLVVDPESTEINQAYLGYKGLPGTAFKFGRQVITYDNHRFVGDVGWRQNQQTFDALSVVNTSLPGSAFSYAHVTNVNRIFSERHVNQGDLEMKGDLLNLSYKWLPGTLVGYAYLLDYDPNQVPFAVTASNKTLGVRFDGATKIGGPSLLYTAEYAQQSDYKDGASTIDADYMLGMLGVDVVGVQIKLNYEKLSGDGIYALQTPLATLHAHNGWADKFLTTPADGIIDVFLSVGTKLGPVNLLGVYHDYSSDNLGYAFGSELNLLASWKAHKLLTLLVKYADYQGDANTTNVTRNLALSRDVSKVWLQADVQF